MPIKEDNYINSRTPVFWRDFLAGYISGVANVLSGQPFDICKVRMQASGKKTAQQILNQIILKEGVSKLWAGSTFPIVFYGVCNSIVFAVNEKSKFLLRSFQNKKELSGADLMLSGAAAGALSSFITAPVEHMRIKMQTDTNQLYKSGFDTAKAIYKGHGIKGIFRGFRATFLRDSLLYAAYFGVYEHLKQAYPHPSKGQLMSFGGLAGMSGWTVAYALDSIKSKIQADSLTNPRFPSFTAVIKNAKPAQLMRGFHICMFRAFPVNAITFLVYEMSASKLYSTNSLE